VPVKGSLAFCAHCENFKEAHKSPGEAWIALQAHMATRHKTLSKSDRMMLDRMKIEAWDGSTD
jgi:hypothetical protein